MSSLALIAVISMIHLMYAQLMSVPYVGLLLGHDLSGCLLCLSDSDRSSVCCQQTCSCLALRSRNYLLRFWLLLKKSFGSSYSLYLLTQLLTKKVKTVFLNFGSIVYGIPVWYRLKLLAYYSQRRKVIEDMHIFFELGFNILFTYR
jgi:hypothetical protein